jgi:Tuberculosis necrotizing toxin
VGGVFNGIAALRNGRSLWNGTLPNPKVSPITLPSPAGIDNSSVPKPESNVKLPNTAEPSVAPTNQAQTANKITITKNVDGNGYKVDGLGIKNYPPNNGAVNGTKNLEYLQKGAQIDRYGSPNGTYASPTGTPLELRSLPPSNSGVLNSFEVLKPFPVQSSTIAPWYNQPGGGIQYKLPKNINWLLENGFIKQ